MISADYIRTLEPYVSIVESGKKVGNLDARFSKEQDLALHRQRFLNDTNLSKEQLVYMDAKGGSTFVDLKNNPKDIRRYATDALITDCKNVGLVLLPADCVPLVVYDPLMRVLALVHLGWRGCVEDLHTKVVSYLQTNYGVEASNLSCYMGPSIKMASYKMPNIHPAQQEDRWLSFAHFENGVYSIDLPGFIKSELLSLGVKLHNIHISKIDTAADRDYFSNYRYNQEPSLEEAGRNGFLAWRSI